MAGDGSVDKGMQGVAPNVQILSWGHIPSMVNRTNDFSSSTADLEKSWMEANQILSTEVDLMNISMSHRSNDCQFLGIYSASSKLLDQMVQEKVIITESSGNDGYICSIGTASSGYNTIKSPATSKNPIAVGSIDIESGKISDFSSSGPTKDGRIKPDVVAPGSHGTAKIKSTGLPTVDYRISADYGQVVIMKSNTSSSLDMIGPPVNMCTKINHMAPKNGIVIGGDMYQMVNKFSDYSFKSFGEFSLGFKQVYPVFTVARKNNL